MKRMKVDLKTAFEEIANNKPEMKKTSAEGLDVDYTLLLPKAIADELMAQLENTVEYYDGEHTKVKVFGKWHEIPRQQVSYGDSGLKYTFSGITIPAKPWTSILMDVKQLLADVTGFQFNFVLINRYRNGLDHIGYHRDAEAELDKNTPIASLSLGQERQFVLQHKDARKPLPNRRKIPSVKISLQHGSLLLMNPPTNDNWLHALPVRKTAPGVRINLTFRKINV